MKDLSIIIPVHNTKPTLIKKCINSIQNINEKEKINYEILIVNDGSDDKETIDFINKVNNGKNIFLINLKDNLGASIARQIGIESAKGNFISFVDSDDEVSDNYFLILKKIILDNRNVSIIVEKKIYWIAHKIIVKKTFLTKNKIIYNSSLSKQNNFYEDLHFFIKCFLICNNINFIKIKDNNEFYRYNKELQINTNSIKDRKLIVVLRYLQIINAFLETNSEFSKKNFKKIRLIFKDNKLFVKNIKSCFKKYPEYNDLYKLIKEINFPKLHYSIFNIAQMIHKIKIMFLNYLWNKK